MPLFVLRATLLVQRRPQGLLLVGRHVDRPIRQRLESQDQEAGSRTRDVLPLRVKFLSYRPQYLNGRRKTDRGTQLAEHAIDISTHSCPDPGIHGAGSRLPLFQRQSAGTSTLLPHRQFRSVLGTCLARYRRSMTRFGGSKSTSRSASPGRKRTRSASTGGA